MKKKGKIIISIMLCIVLFATMLVVPVFTNVIEPISENVKAEEEEPDFPLPPEEPITPPTEVYNITLSGISTYSVSQYPQIIFVNTLTKVNITLNKTCEGYTTNVIVNVYEVRFDYKDPDPGGELPEEPYNETVNHLRTLSYSEFPKGEKTETVNWIPTETGEVEIRLNISYNEASNDVVYEDGATVYVARDDLPIIEKHEDWIIDQNVTMDNVTIILHGDLIVKDGATLTLENCYMSAPDIIVEDGTTRIRGGATNMDCDFRGQYKIWVMHRGTLRLEGTMIYNDPAENTYHFYVDGILKCMRWNGQYTRIYHVWGEDRGSSEIGGIELKNTNPDKQSEFSRTYIRECDTIGIKCSGSSPTIGPYVNIYWCGSVHGRGKGILVENATASPTIERSYLRYNARTNNFLGYGIKLKNVASATILYCRIYSNTYAGIYCDSSSSFAIIIDNWIYFNRNYGIYCRYTSPTIQDNWIYGNDRYGIYAYYSAPTISLNDIYYHYYGIYSYRTPSIMMVDDNYIRSSSNYIHGIVMRYSTAIIQDNDILYNGRIGIYMAYSSVTIQNNNIEGNEYAGIYMSRSSATIQNNVIESNGHGWDNDMGGIYGYYSIPTIENNDIISNDGWGIWMRYGAPTNEDTIGAINNYVPNNDEGRIWQQWWVRVLVKDDDTGDPIEGAQVEIEDVFDIPPPIWTGFTNINGYTPMITVTEYQIHNDASVTDFNDHIVRAEHPPDYLPNEDDDVEVDDNMITVIYLEPI